MLFHGNCKIKCISIGFEGKIAPIHFFSKTKSHCTNLIKVNDLPFVEESENLPKSDKYLGISGKGEVSTAQRHKCTHVQTLCWHTWHRQLWQGWNGDPGEAGQGQGRASYSSLLSGLLCCKRGYAFGVPLMVRHIECRHKSFLCKARVPKNWGDANLTQRFTPQRKEYPRLCKICALLVSTSRLAGIGGSKDTDGADSLNSSIWKNPAGCWDLWLFAELLPSRAPWWACGGGYGKTRTVQPPQSLQRAFGCISIIDNINYAHCSTPPWERLSIPANVFKSVRCSRSRRFLLPLNGREQRYCVESRRLREIASEAEQLFLFHTKLPMVRAAFPFWGDTKVGKKLHITTFLSQPPPSNVSAAERTWGWHRASCLANADAWMFTEPLFYTAAFLLPDYFQNRELKKGSKPSSRLGKASVLLSSPARKRKDLR